MTANYPLRWDPVPAGCHGDIARASVNAGAAAGNHPDPELTGKTVQPVMLWLTHSLPPCSPHHQLSICYYMERTLHTPQAPFRCV